MEIVVVSVVAGVAALFGLGWWLTRRDRGRREHAALAERTSVVAAMGAELSAAHAGLESLPEGIVVFDTNGSLSYVNAAARDLIGRRFDSVEELAPAVLRDACRAAVTARAPGELEFETAGRSVQASVVVDGRGPASGVGTVLVLRDVTAARRNDRIRRDFVANASHELKTPVSSIAALAEALAEATGRDAAASERFVTLLQKESQRLARLAADLLDLSRLEGEAPAHAPVPFGRVVAEETGRLRSEAVAAGLTFVVEPLDDAEVTGSESDLGLLVHNLLDNAVHYTPSGGEVRISLKVKEGWAILEVADTGIGIASRDLDRVFERFYRADPARSRQTGGTGLGLSIVKHVAEAHGGDVRLHSVLGAGSTFTVRLPLAGSARA
jgi:two-component system sensor histidine kinase SenX3